MFARSKGKQEVEEEEAEEDKQFKKDFPGFAERAEVRTLSGFLADLDPDPEFDFEAAYDDDEDDGGEPVEWEEDEAAANRFKSYRYG